MSIEKTLFESDLIIKYKKAMLCSEELPNIANQIRGDIQSVRRIVLDLRQVDDFDSTTSHFLSVFCRAFQRMSMEVMIQINTNLFPKIEIDKIPFAVVDICDPETNSTEPPRNPAFGFEITSLFWIFRENAFETIGRLSNHPLLSGQVKRITQADISEQIDAGGISEIEFRDFKGTFVLGFSKEVYLKFMSRFFGEEQTAITPINQDGAAELLNGIVGKARPMVAYNFGEFQISAPHYADPKKIAEITSLPQLSCSFSSEYGDFWLKLITHTPASAPSPKLDV